MYILATQHFALSQLIQGYQKHCALTSPLYKAIDYMTEFVSCILLYNFIQDIQFQCLSENVWFSPTSVYKLQLLGWYCLYFTNILLAYLGLIKLALSHIMAKIWDDIVPFKSTGWLCPRSLTDRILDSSPATFQNFSHVWLCLANPWTRAVLISVIFQNFFSSFVLYRAARSLSFNRFPAVHGNEKRSSINHSG